MRAALALLALLVTGTALAGCVGPVPPRAEPQLATAADLAAGLEMDGTAGWAGVRVALDAAFWDAIEGRHQPRQLPILFQHGGYFLAGVREPESGAIAFFGSSSSGFVLGWDDTLQERPAFELLLLAAAAGTGTAAFGVGGLGGPGTKVLPHFRGAGGAGGFVGRFPYDDHTVLIAREGVLRFNESYVQGAATPAGAFTPQRATTVHADGELGGPGLAACSLHAFETLGAAAWRFRFAAGPHSWEAQGAGAWPGAEVADAAPGYFWAPVEAGPIRLEVNRTYSGFVTALGGGDVFAASCAWADLDPRLLGWNVEAHTPEDDVRDRALRLLPLRP